jgi:hypothetical protein
MTSKHQGRYQWHEVQKLVREIARRYHEQHHPPSQNIEIAEDSSSVTPINPPHEQVTSRVLREEAIRAQRAQMGLRQSSSYAHSKVINLQAFREAWSNRDQQTSELKPNHEGNNADQKSDLESARRIDSSPKIEDTFVSTSPQKRFRSIHGSEQPNPWEMLRDHFIQLREKRLALDEQKHRQTDDDT